VVYAAARRAFRRQLVAIDYDGGGGGGASGEQRAALFVPRPH